MSIQVIPLSEGGFGVGHDKIFYLLNRQIDHLTERPQGSLLVEIQPFLVIAEGVNMLFDTGLGFTLPNGQLQIHQNLAKHGMEPNDIHKVFLSHLHKDHAGGICFDNEQGVRTFSFPKATYYVNKNEFDYAMLQGQPSYVIEDFELLKNSNQVEWLSEKGTIQNSIFYEQTGGHCPYHTIFLVQQNEESYFFGGDVVPQFKQLIMRYVAKYDYDGKESMLLRERYALEGKNGRWNFMFYHDVKQPLAQL